MHAPARGRPEAERAELRALLEDLHLQARVGAHAPVHALEVGGGLERDAHHLAQVDLPAQVHRASDDLHARADADALERELKVQFTMKPSYVDAAQSLIVAILQDVKTRRVAAARMIDVQVESKAGL